MANRGRQRTRRQHVVSRFYLTGFADDQDRLRRVVLPGEDSHIVSARDATVVNDFYTVVIGGESSDLFERLFSQFEQPAARALARVVADRQWPLSPDDKAALAVWIALQHLRSEGVRRSQTQLRAQTIRLVVGVSGKEMLRRHIEVAEGRPIDDARLDAEWADLTQAGGPNLNEDIDEHIRTVLDLLEPTAMMLGSLQWSLSVFQRKVLVTSDHPVVLVPYDNHPEWSGVGLANAGGYALPLARRLGLVIGASPDLPDMRVPGTAKLAASLNGHVILNARKAVFHHPDDAEALAMITLPPERTEEFGPVNDDHFIREEGLFTGLNQEQLRGLSLPPGDEDRGFSLNDLPWPIPGRRFQPPE